jgi:peptidyl-Lys metalloendopeptidase
MKLINVVSCSAVLVGTIAAAASAQPSARSNPLRVSVIAAQASSGGFLGAVEVTLTSTSNHTVRVRSGSCRPISWKPSCSRSAVTASRCSTRPMIKRGLPRAEDFAILRAGETVRTTIDLSGSYDMSRSGEYIVTLSSPCSMHRCRTAKC